MLARGAVGVNIAQIVDHQNPHRERADGDSRRPSQRHNFPPLHKIRAAYGGETKEEKYKKLAESMITQWERSSRIRDGAENRQNPNHQHHHAPNHHEIQTY